MKTNQVMTRPMGSFHVAQRTKDGMFNATELLNQWNASSGQQKQISHYFDNNNTKEFINALMVEENFKERDSVYLKSRGKYNGGTWMHPIMFIDFAMWLNPSFKVQAIKFVYDQMLKYRNDAGDAYKELSSAVSKIVPKSFMVIAMQKIGEALNYVVFNQHEPMLRNKNGEESSMKELYELEYRLVENINDGLLSSFEQVIYFLRRRYSNKYYPKVFR